MGYNTVAVIMNDALTFIEADPNFGKKLSAAVLAYPARYRDRPMMSVSARCESDNGSVGIHCNALTVISQDHASGEQVVVVQGNAGRRVQDANDLSWQALDAMKECLERHGYKVTKRKKSKATNTPEPAHVDA